MNVISSQSVRRFPAPQPSFGVEVNSNIDLGGPGIDLGLDVGAGFDPGLDLGAPDLGVPGTGFKLLLMQCVNKF